MKLEEAIAKAKILNDSLKELTDEYEGQGSFIAAGMAVSFKLVLDTILTALRPVSREQVERVWPGCEACKDAGLAIGEVQFYGPFEGPIDVSGNMHYCPNCGRPITPVAKDRQGKRLETLKDEKSDL